jgi:hypothetical protein
MASLLPLLVGLGWLVGNPGAARPSDSVCHPMDSAGQGVLAWVRSVATRTDGGSRQQRAMMRLSLVSDEDIRYVTDERICRGVLTEYNRYSGTRDATTGVESAPSEQVCVVEVGSLYPGPFRRLDQVIFTPKSPWILRRETL